ncbi:MAG: transglycosylase SLT domain-containing protein [Rhodoferax sp.]|nr:transglycosylase SLT domain-containing protein [Rhodoferax sp.]
MTIANCQNLSSLEQLHRTNHLLAAALFTISLCAATPAAADVFHFVAEDGTSHFSDQPSDPRFRLLLRTGVELRAASPRPLPRRGPHDARRHFALEISAAAQASGIDADLLHAVVKIESGFNPNAVSPKGAQGLMQLMPATARRYGVADPFDAAQNLRGGAHHLRDLLNQFSNNKELALAAYNAGAGAVLAHGRRIPPYAETARYVPAVLQTYELLRRSTQAIVN